MSSTVISVEHLSKAYRLGQIGTGTLTNDLRVWWAKARGKPNPLLKIGQKDPSVRPSSAVNRPSSSASVSPSSTKDERTKDETTTEVGRRRTKDEGLADRDSDTIWALRDVTFEVKQGEVLGIIGRNGAGKSTILKILSRITAPTQGEVKVKGRIASLLEVGTGFHPELTGRENTYLNGAILGMTKTEVDRKFDEIVAFSEVAQFIDTPVKRYSSGMYVRLAFAVAAHLEPEVLLVDEVLAVGDAAFQKKCIGKMGDVAKGGRTVLFVSHNMAAIRQLCGKCILLEGGRQQQMAASVEVVGLYLRRVNAGSATAERHFAQDDTKEFQLRSARLVDGQARPAACFSCDEPIGIEMTCQVHRHVPGLYGYMSLNREDGTEVLISDSQDLPPNPLDELAPGEYMLRIWVPARSLAAGSYSLYINFTSSAGIKGFNVDSPGTILSFQLDDHGSRRGNSRGGFFSTLLGWQVARVEASSHPLSELSAKEQALGTSP